MGDDTNCFPESHLDTEARLLLFLTRPASWLLLVSVLRLLVIPLLRSL
jgi:hypothetical protein